MGCQSLTCIIKLHSNPNRTPTSLYTYLERVAPLMPSTTPLRNSSTESLLYLASPPNMSTYTQPKLQHYPRMHTNLVPLRCQHSISKYVRKFHSSQLEPFSLVHKIPPSHISCYNHIEDTHHMLPSQKYAPPTHQ